MHLLAQKITIGGVDIVGPLKIEDPLNPGVILDDPSLSIVINRVLIFVTPFAGVLLFFVILWGGYDILLSQGNPEKLKTGSAKIKAGLAGFLILVLAYFISGVVGYIFGLGGGIL